MTSETLAKNLNTYKVYIEYWEPEANDTFLLVGLRGWLQRHESELTLAEQLTLVETDQKVLQMAGQQYAPETGDVEDLRLIADIIKGASGQKAA